MKPVSLHSSRATSEGGSAQHTDPAVTIIVPVFNSQRFLPRCIDSLRSQTLKEIEFLFVDDGSSDNSPTILEEFARVDHRIRILRLEHNSGPAVARNLGLDHATGRYVRFVDSDDVIPAESTALLLASAGDNEAEIVRGNCLKFKEGSEEPMLPADNIHWTSMQAGLAYGNANFHGLPHFHQAFLFDKRFLEKHALRYPDVRMGEDPIFLLQALLKSARASTISNIVYYYREYKDTGDRWTLESNREDYLKHFVLMKKTWLAENKLAEWEKYLQFTFWHFWKLNIDGDRQRSLQCYNTTREILANARDDELTSPYFRINWDIVRAIRDKSYSEVEELLGD